MIKPGTLRVSVEDGNGKGVGQFADLLAFTGTPDGPDAVLMADDGRLFHRPVEFCRIMFAAKGGTNRG